MKSFHSQLETYINNWSEQHRERLRREIDRVLQSGAVSYKDWLDLIADPKADPALRLTACSVVGSIGNSRAFPALGQALQDEDAHIRGCAAGALAHLRLHVKRGTFPQVVDQLLRAIQDDDEMDVRLQAAFALREFRDPRSVEPLIAVIIDQKQPAPVRDVAAEALAYIPDVRSIAVMRGALHDPAEVVRITAAYTLGSLADFYAHKKLKDPKASLELERAFAPLLAALHDPSEKVRYWAVNALGSLGDSRAITALQHVAETDQGTWYGDEVAEVARYTIQAIQRSGRKK